ncbi:MAG: hypothetical protein ACOVLC_05935 [Flavobacterium sp.]
MRLDETIDGIFLSINTIKGIVYYVIDFIMDTLFIKKEVQCAYRFMT